ncbi:MAG: sulfite exporter TauE/SafE family protein [Planctomycetota bacterium]
MLALVTAVFLASLLGSLHCVGMCGAFVALAFNDTPAGDRWRVSFAYHGGRLATYVLLGVVGGAVGSLLNMAGALAGVQRVALPVAGFTVVAFAAVALLRQRGVKLQGLKLPEAWVARVRRVQQLAMSLTPTRRAWAIGGLTTLLPCGWLYAFAATAAGTGDPLRGGVVMAVFWSGTVPAMAVVGVGFQSLSGPLARHLPVVTCLVLMAFGGWAVAGRGHLDASGLAAAATQVDVTAPGVAAVAPCHAEVPLRFDPETGVLIEDPAALCGAKHSVAESVQ